jgi:hypothetical protein
VKVAGIGNGSDKVCQEGAEGWVKNAILEMVDYYLISIEELKDEWVEKRMQCKWMLWRAILNALNVNLCTLSWHNPWHLQACKISVCYCAVAVVVVVVIIEITNCFLFINFREYDAVLYVKRMKRDDDCWCVIIMLWVRRSAVRSIPASLHRPPNHLSLRQRNCKLSRRALLYFGNVAQVMII